MDLLRKFSKNLRSSDLLNFIFICLSLGFSGNGRSERDYVGYEISRITIFLGLDFFAWDFPSLKSRHGKYLKRPDLAVGGQTNVFLRSNLAEIFSLESSVKSGSDRYLDVMASR